MRAALALVLALSLAHPAIAAPPDLLGTARKHYEAGRALYQLGKYEQAIVEFEEGYRMAPRPSFLVNIAQCDRQLGRFDHARLMYEKYLAAAPLEDPMRREVKQILGSLPPSSGAPSPTPSPTEPPTPNKPTLAPAPLPPPGADLRPRRRWQRDPLGGVLLAGGIAAVVAGVVLLGYSGYRLAHAADTYEDYLAARDAPDQRLAGIIVLSAGVALAGGGAIRYAVIASRF
jgi:tetratricopeptide (TPR) repeat protein